MKMLMIGMDGVQEATFKRGWTPFIASLIEAGSSIELKEDLISRGWAEIVTGQHASITKAVYEGPLANGDHLWSDKYKLSDTPGLGESMKPIWQVLNDMGLKVGVMNVPTTFPAPKVDGFFVSGGGGGGPIGQDVMPEQCFPIEIQKYLADFGYIVDERLPSLLGEKKLYEPKDFYAQLQRMNEKRTDSFVELSKQYQIDFGFLVYKSSIVTAETLLIPELARCENTHEKSDFIDASESFYRDFDNKIMRLVKSFPDAQVVMVSDHSMALRKWSVNANAFLSEIGMQNSSTSKASTYSFIKSFKHLVPLSIKKLLKKSSKIKSSYESMTTFDVTTSKAFSVSFSQGQHGIFINDQKRFGGPVVSEDIDSYKKKIIEAFNEHEICRAHDFKAYCVKNEQTNIVDQFPDIVLDLPDGYLTSSEYQKFVTAYAPKVDKYDLREAVKGKHHTIKAHYPLAVTVNSPWLLKSSDNKSDLRFIYDHVVSFFSKSN